MVFSTKIEKGVVKMQFLDSFFDETVNFAQKCLKKFNIGEISAGFGYGNSGFLYFRDKNGQEIDSFHFESDSKLEILGQIEAKMIDFLSEFELKNTGNRKVQNEKYTTI